MVLLFFRDETEREFVMEKLGREAEPVDFDKMTTMIADCGKIMVTRRMLPRFPNPTFPGKTFTYAMTRF